jgi:Abnormal spindle-like microcephaly-assoc'd, ASPM-SPD-2-Hydin
VQEVVAVKTLESRWSKISRGLRLFFFFVAILVLTSHAFGAASPLTVNPSNINFGSVSVGSSQTQSVALANSGGPKLTITQATLSGTGFTLSGLSYPVTLAGGQSVTCDVTFTPQSPGTNSGSVAIAFITHGKDHYGLTASSSIAVTLPVSGTGVTSGQLTANPTSLGFGSVQVGNSKTLSETLTNSGGTSVMISAANSSSSAFTASGLSLPITLNAGQSVSFNVAFSPTSGGSASGNLAITSNASNPALNVPLSGTGTTPGQLTANPTSLSFGSVQVGNSQTLAETLTNSGGTSVTISAASATSSGFTASGLSLPITLGAGQSVRFSVAFSPTSGGSVTGNLTITSNASNPALNVPLSGTGTTPGQLTANPTSLSFGSVQVGNSQTLAETLTNSGGTSVTISAAIVSSSGFNLSGLSLPITLGAGQSVSFSVAFSPTSGGSATGNLAITSNASNPALNVPLSGTGTASGQLTANPTSLGFGSVQVGNSQTLAETLTNSGGSSVTISAASSSSSGFTASGLSLPITLSAGQSVTFNVSFAPQSGGSATGSLVISSNGSNPSLSVSLTGTGTLPGQLAVSPSTINFGNVIVGTTQNQTGTLSASNAPVTVSSVGVNGSEFSVSGISLPVTIAAGNSVLFQVTFAPQTSGTASANLTFASNASSSATVQSLTGSGTPPPQHSVALTWNASTSSSVVGYNVYRGTVSGGPYTQINSALDSTTSDTDSTVQGGQTYYYVVTAVDSTGAESSYSNETQAVIPSP